MSNANWKSLRTEEAHVCLTESDLQEVHHALGNDPNEIVIPPARPTGLVYVDEQGFDMRPGRSKRNKFEILQLAPSIQPPSKPIETIPKEPAVELLTTSPVKVRSGKATVRRPDVSVEIERPLPAGWEVFTRYYQNGKGLAAGRTYKVYKGDGKEFLSYTRAERYWKGFGSDVSSAVSPDISSAKSQRPKRPRPSAAEKRPVKPDSPVPGPSSLEDMVSRLRALATGGLNTPPCSEEMMQSVLAARTAVCIKKRSGRLGPSLEPILQLE